ncbi:MAG TPA: hypothetical protein VFX13_07250, partial [Gaiellales bacterium]|nr:hypothetical protein [Gaiellales bacterium]
DGLWQELRFESLVGRDDRDPWPPRNVVALSVGGKNREWAGRMRREDWVPDVFIGVCDGCRLGGTPRDFCVNRLVRHGMSAGDARATRLPRWWITDHFADAQPTGQLAVGDYITSTDPDFPVRFRKRALLSSEWGHYGHGAIPGATLFQVDPVDGH